VAEAKRRPTGRFDGEAPTRRLELCSDLEKRARFSAPGRIITLL
jgi:hypothetical protein